MKKMLFYIEVRIEQEKKKFNRFLLSNSIGFQLEQR